MAEKPRLALSLEKLDQLAEDVAKLDIARVVTVDDKTVPSFQRDGYLEEANKKTLKWESRYFVLRDSCLLSYETHDVSKIVEPQTCICLGKCKVQLLDNEEELDKLVGKLIDCKGKHYCIHITTRPDKEHVLLCAKSAEERAGWVEAIKVARTITHANMVKLAVENRVLAEEKGAAAVTLNNSTSALAIFSNRDYIQKTPIAGGAEGWLRTAGFKSTNTSDGKKSGKLFGLFGQSELKKLKKRYCILKDSHLLLYEAGDALLKPRGVMYLVGTAVENMPDEAGSFRFRCSSPQCGDYIDFIASSEKRRRRWVFALKIGARVTYPDFRMLMEEHALLANVTMTPRAARPPKPHEPSNETEDVAPIMLEDVDVQDKEMDAGAQQPYDEEGQPMLRTPEGKLVDVTGIEITPSTPRYSSSGGQLDNFNRPLPPGAVPMFTEDGKPIGVGPDGQHYLADGTIVPETQPHFDAGGKQLAIPTVTAANAVAQNISVALKVRARLRGENNDAVDVFGRGLTSTGGRMTNADGEEVPLESARRVKDESGQMVDYKPVTEPNQTATLHINVETESDDESTTIGSVEVDEKTSLRDVRRLIEQEVETTFPDFLFIYDMSPLLKYEEQTVSAMSCLPAVHIRGKELSSVDHLKDKTFNKKIDSLIHEQAAKAEEQKEFEDIMKRVRSGTFLKPLHKSLLDEP